MQASIQERERQAWVVAISLFIALFLSFGVVIAQRQSPCRTI
jgi:hypothetical protein